MEKFIPKIEFAPLAEIKKYQEMRLAETLTYLQSNSPYYRKFFCDNHIDITKIKTLEDLQLIPITEKANLQLYNNDFISVPKEDLVEFLTTSGTLGSPVMFALNSHDLERLAYNEAISFASLGVQKSDIFQIMTTLDKRFMAGMAYYTGMRMMGTGVCRVGNGLPELQWDTINQLRPSGIVCVPSFILKLIDYAEKNGIDYRNASVKRAVCIGENLRKQDFSLSLLGERIKEKWDIELYSTYASTELSASFCECTAQKGGHLHPELVIVEVVDAQGNVVKEGETGELVITNLGVQAMPLLRFKTGDICCFHYEPCSCGRTSPRISPILGRHSQMIKLKGTSLYPPAIYDVLDQVSYVKDYVVELCDTDFGTDDLNILLYANPCIPNLVKDLKDRFRSHLRIAPNIILKNQDEIRTLQGQGRKIIKFIDRRKQQ